MLKPFGKSSWRGNMLLADREPFDISRPNQHDSKAEFQREKEAVDASIEHVRQLVITFVNPKHDDEHKAMLSRLQPIP